MKEQQPPQKAAQLDLTIKPLSVPVPEVNSSNDPARKARVVVATFY
jgi:hypothetical protein